MLGVGISAFLGRSYHSESNGIPGVSWAVGILRRCLRPSGGTSTRVSISMCFPH